MLYVSIDGTNVKMTLVWRNKPVMGEDFRIIFVTRWIVMVDSFLFHEVKFFVLKPLFILNDFMLQVILAIHILLFSQKVVNIECIRHQCRIPKM